MNQEPRFETIPFEINPEFQGEVFEDENEWGWGTSWLPAAWTTGSGTLSPYNKPSVTPKPVPSSATPSLPNATRFPVSESALTSLLPAFTDYTYDFKSVYYPWALPGVSLPLAPPKLINCCTFAEALLVKAWANTYGQAFQWNSKRHGQMMITSANDLFSPVTAVIEAEMGTPVPANQPPSAWCLLQGWRSSTSGHTFIVVAYHAATDRVLTLEANAAYSIKGVGYRNFGSLRDFLGGQPPSRWWENSAAPTWRGILSAYPQGLKMAKLNVYGLSWSGLQV
jgi:hypothetical protein